MRVKSVLNNSYIHCSVEDVRIQHYQSEPLYLIQSPRTIILRGKVIIYHTMYKIDLCLKRFSVAFSIVEVEFDLFL